MAMEGVSLALAICEGDIWHPLVADGGHRALLARRLISSLKRERRRSGKGWRGIYLCRWLIGGCRTMSEAW